MIAHQCHLEPGEFIWTGGDCHIYSTHVDKVHLQLSREPKPLPYLAFKRRPPSLFDYKFEDLVFIGYEAHPPIRAQVAV
jgi:thymidylate synthase